MSVRTDRKKDMYGLHQSPRGAVETEDSNSLEAALRELREETGLKIHQSRPKWIGYDPKYDCDVYAIELDIRENPRWTEQDKMGPWGIIPWTCILIWRRAGSSHQPIAHIPKCS